MIENGVKTNGRKDNLNHFVDAGLHDWKNFNVFVGIGIHAFNSPLECYLRATLHVRTARNLIGSHTGNKMEGRLEIHLETI